MGEDVLRRQRLLQGLRRLPGAQEGDPSQRRQRLARMDLAEHEGEHLHAETGPDPPGHDGVHLPQHPRHRLRRHDADHRLPARPGQARDDASHVRRVQVPDQLPGGALPSGPDKLLDRARDLRCPVERDRLRRPDAVFRTQRTRDVHRVMSHEKIPPCRMIVTDDSNGSRCAARRRGEHRQGRRRGDAEGRPVRRCAARRGRAPVARRRRQFRLGGLGGAGVGVGVGVGDAIGVADTYHGCAFGATVPAPVAFTARATGPRSRRPPPPSVPLGRLGWRGSGCGRGRGRRDRRRRHVPGGGVRRDRARAGRVHGAQVEPVLRPAGQTRDDV